MAQRTYTRGQVISIPLKGNSNAILEINLNTDAFANRLSNVTVDAYGRGTFTLATDASWPVGRYVIFCSEVGHGSRYRASIGWEMF